MSGRRRFDPGQVGGTIGILFGLMVATIALVPAELKFACVACIFAIILITILLYAARSKKSP